MWGGGIQRVLGAPLRRVLLSGPCLLLHHCWRRMGSFQAAPFCGSHCLMDKGQVLGVRCCERPSLICSHSSPVALWPHKAFAHPTPPHTWGFTPLTVHWHFYLLFGEISLTPRSLLGLPRLHWSLLLPRPERTKLPSPGNAPPAVLLPCVCLFPSPGPPWCQAPWLFTDLN